MKSQDDLERTIDGLKEMLRVAWKDLANSLIPPFERRELRNRIKEHSTELRRYLQVMQARRSRVRSQSLEERGSHGSGKPKLRVLVGGL
jgi:hypothetical protein